MTKPVNLVVGCFVFFIYDSGACNLEELQKKLREVLMIRRMKEDVLTQLPAKQRQQILFQLKDSQVSKVHCTLLVKSGFYMFNNILVY